MNLHRNTLNLLSATAMTALLVGASARVIAADKAAHPAGGGKKLLIYVLAGQSNMQGHAEVSTLASNSWAGSDRNRYPIRQRGDIRLQRTDEQAGEQGEARCRQGDGDDFLAAIIRDHGQGGGGGGPTVGG